MLLKHLVDSRRHCPITFSSISVPNNRRKLHKGFQVCTGDKCINKDGSKALFTVIFTSSITPRLVLVWLMSHNATEGHSCVVLYCAVLNCKGGVPWHAWAMTSPYICTRVSNPSSLSIIYDYIQSHSGKLMSQVITTPLHNYVNLVKL